MRMPQLIATVSLVAFAAISTACNSKPVSVRDVDPSVLPTEAKSLLSNESQTTRVQEEIYQGGARKYVIHYTLNGEEKSIKYLDKHTSDPHYVMERDRK